MIYRCFPIVASLLITVGLLIGLTGQQLVVAESDTQQQTIESIDTYVTEQMNNLGIPGVAIGIVRGDQIVYTQGYGVADDTGSPVTPDTPFLIASLSKSFTALGIMQLVEVGKIDLDAPVQNYLPWFRVADADASSKITIRHLLNHSSGLSERQGYRRNLNSNPAGDALEASIRDLKKEALNSPPGTAFEYSNTNYDILGLVIQAVSGQSYESYIQEKIFAPLGMTHSYTSLADARQGNASSGYYSFFGFPLTVDSFMPHSKITVPSAGLFSSAQDMASYLIAHLNQGNYQVTSILSPSGIANLHAPGIKYSENASYAMGWAVFPFTDAAAASLDGRIPTGLAHRGEWVGFSSIMVLIPELETGIVALINKSDPSQGPAIFNLGWSLSMLAMGVEPISTPQADFLARYGRGLLAGVILLLGISLVWSIRKLRRLSVQEGIDARQKPRLIALTILLALIDLFLAGWLLFVQLPENNDTLSLALHFNPDIGLMYGLLLALTLGWGLLRTILFLAYISKARASVIV